MIDVIHNPFGQEHPYEQLPEERFPRMPLAGQPFTVGIVTRPPEQVKDVKVYCQLEGEAKQEVPVTRLDNWQPELEEGVGAEFLERIVKIDQDVWSAQLVAPQVGQELIYWVEAAGESTEQFQLKGFGWHEAGAAKTIGNDEILITQSADRQGVYPHTIKKIEWLTDGQTAYRVRISLHCDADERFYGTGERFNTLNQRGQILDVRCYEQYKNHGKRTYMPIPFVLSSAGYGVWVQSSRWMQFDFAVTSSDYWMIEADLGDEPLLKLTWFQNDDPFTSVGAFAQLTGPVVLPPRWAFGLWMSGNEWNTQAKIEQEVNTSLAHDIQPSVVVIEAWSDETTFYIWNDAQYTPVSGDDRLRYDNFTFTEGGKWSDPRAMVQWLHSLNIKLLLWQIPVMKFSDGTNPQHEADIQYYEESGFGVREADGTLHRVRPFWFRGGTIWDMTNPAERDWWFKKRAYLLEDVGIDGFKTDGGEHLWGESVVFADGRRGSEVWNDYPRLYSEAYYEFANRHTEAVTFSRAGFTGSQRAPLHWAGDENSTWNAFRHSVLAGLSAGASGISFWGWDIAGFSGDIPDAELYLRAAAMAAFCPVMQYHSEYNAHRSPSHDRTPWNIQERTGDDQVIVTFRHFVKVRELLMDYIWMEAQFSAETGRPMMRAVQISDVNASQYDYFFGRDLLVCPVVYPNITKTNAHLPKGRWQCLWTGTLYDGDQTIEMAVPLDRIPVFVRDGANVAISLLTDPDAGQ